MSDDIESPGREAATAEDLSDRLAALRARMASLEETITPHQAQPPAPTPAEATTRTPSPPPPSVADVPRPDAAVIPPEADTIWPAPVTPAPGVDPDDPVLALGVADPDALDAWLTDEVAAVDPHATGELEPVTAEMDAFTKPSVYDTLTPGMHDIPPVPPQRTDVTVEAVQASVRPTPRIDRRRLLTLLVVAAVLIGMAVAVALWLSSQPNDDGTVLISPFSNL